MEYNELLDIYRNQIDTLDKEIIYLLGRRFKIVNEIGKLKKENNIEAFQKDRWEQLMKENLEMAQECEVSQELVKEIWDMIHEKSLEIEI
ncbi:MAG: chorismate mutase [Candidatus Gracilibacteria bacterium]|nr:chorismate mutase [Candidatus Gracilibacteria bacterium]